MQLQVIASVAIAFVVIISFTKGLHRIVKVILYPLLYIHVGKKYKLLFAVF